MGEYYREQRNQLSRAIANSGTGSSQLKGFVDNRRKATVQRFQVYRNGGRNPGNLTPRLADTNGNVLSKRGLSTFINNGVPPYVTGPHKQVIETTNLGPNLTTAVDGNHVSIIPVIDDTAARNIANWQEVTNWANRLRPQFTAEVQNAIV